MVRASIALLLLVQLAGCGARSALSLGEEPGADAGAGVDARDAAPSARDAHPPRPRLDLGGGDDAWPPASCAGADVVLRYAGGATDPAPIRLERTVRVQAADVYFLFDTTGSMVGEIAVMRAAVVDLIDGLACPSGGAVCADDRDCPAQACSPLGRCAPTEVATTCLPDPHVGVGRYAGQAETYQHLADIAPPTEEVARAIPERADGRGQDETLYLSMACALSDAIDCPAGACAASGRRCAGFRPHSLPIVVTITDEGDQCSYCGPDDESIGAQARALGALLIGIDTARPPGGEATRDLTALAMASGSVDAEGRPLVFDGSDGAVVEAVRAGLAAAAGTPLPMSLELHGDEAFVDAVVERAWVDRWSEGCFPYREVEDTDGDGFADRVPRAAPGTRACFVVEPRARVDLPPARHRFSAQLRLGEVPVQQVEVCVEVE